MYGLLFTITPLPIFAFALYVLVSKTVDVIKGEPLYFTKNKEGEYIGHCVLFPKKR